MRKWSKQGFLNPADSNDDGWFKFSIRPYHLSPGKRLGFGVQYIISDCSNKIYLEFGPDSVQVGKDGRIDDKATNVENALQSIKERRKKIRSFSSAVAKVCAMIEENLDDYERQIMELLNKEDSNV